MNIRVTSQTLIAYLLMSALSLAQSKQSIVDAAMRNDVDAVRRLLHEGASANDSNVDGRTAVHVAATMANAEMLALLMSEGGDADLEDKNGATPRYIILLTKDKEARSAMIRSLTPAPSTPAPSSPVPWSLEVAIARRQGPVVQMLLAMGTDPNAKGASDTYPLILAAQKGDAAIVKHLLEKGARINVEDKDGLEAVHLASLAGNIAVVELLLDKGVDINARARSTGETPLYCAAWAGRVQLVALLLGRGAKPGISNAKGVTPHQAALRGAQMEVVKLLEATNHR